MQWKLTSQQLFYNIYEERNRGLLLLAGGYTIIAQCLQPRNVQKTGKTEYIKSVCADKYNSKGKLRNFTVLGKSCILYL